MPVSPKNQERFIVELLASREMWQEFYSNVRPHTFLQTWAWGEFQRRQGNEVFTVGVREEGRLVAVALVVLVIARRGRFLFIPHGPIYANPCAEASLPVLISYLRILGRAHGACFFRISSLLPDSPDNQQIFRRFGFRGAPIHMHPELAWILDLAPDEPVLLQKMRKTTRYLIRRSQALGIRVEQGRSDRDCSNFLALYRATAGRQRFIGFSDKYVHDELDAFGDNARIFSAIFEGRVVASALVVNAGDSVFYHHGASLPLGSRTPAAYLLQWEIIRDSKCRGAKWYNFWGIAPDDQPNHPWAGLTQFKIGFGGFRESYIHAQDLILNKRYWVNYVIERFRRVHRGL